ncbi:MAG: efflux transporter outer membrane subunit, partial [Limnobacter sp.]|nr:efflux transporter outer membrane subunit [Limnobacter sp.]
QKEWWTRFGDPLLNGLIELALIDNQRVARAVAQLQFAQARLKESEAGDSLLASLGLQTSATERSRASNQSEGTRTSLSLDLALPIDTNGKISAQVEAAAMAVRQSQANLRGTILAVSTEVATEYLRFRGNQKQLDLLLESIEVQEKTLGIVQIRFETGLSPELDVRRAETSVQNLKASLPPLEQTLTENRNRLATLTSNTPLEMKVILQAPADLPSYTSPLPLAVPAQAIAQRPDVQVALAQAMSSIAQTDVARADYYPSLRITGSIEAGTLSSLSPSTFAVGTLSALLEQLLIDGDAREARLEQAQATALADLATYELTVQSAIEEIENQLASIMNSRDRLQALEKAAQSSRRSFAQADALYQLGLVSFLDVVDAQRVLANAEQNLAAEKTRQATLVAGLFQILGMQQTN